MNKEIISIALALGCVSSIAATNNYDLLGRKGSKMNSPMVYKNVDYSKIKNEKQKIGQPLESHVLAKTGLSNNIKAIEGAFNSDSKYDRPIYFKRYYTNNQNDVCMNESGTGSGSNHCFYESHKVNHLYYSRAGSAFIGTSFGSASSNSFEPNAGWTNFNLNDYRLDRENVSFSNPIQASPYEYNQNIQYKSSSFVKSSLTRSQREKVAWWFDGIDNPSSNYYDPDAFSDVGVYLANDARPVKIASNKNVSYILHNPNDQFNTTIPEYEMLASKTYSVIKDASKRSIVYVGKSFPEHPEQKIPQIYIGVHNMKAKYGYSSEISTYTNVARDFDNYIYDNRTIEFVAAGDFATKNNASNPTGNGYLAKEAHAANAITVGAVDAYSNQITNYTSYKTSNTGIQKPEIFNYSHFYMNDQKRTYTRKSSGATYVYQPYYDGTEMAAAYTAGMVSDLLMINPFYRWHPEVVKALLISSSHVSLTAPYPHNPKMKKAPSYYGLVFENCIGSDDFKHYSRYWLGDINSLSTHEVDGIKEIWFSYENPYYVPGQSVNHDFSAAISWLSSGTDIRSLGHIPQDFDLFVYESNTATINNVSNIINSNDLIGVSQNGSNPYEAATFTTNAHYILFRIQLYSEDNSSENKGKIVLGFDVASRK